ncbi:hypothetical protein ACVW0Y_002751 [Pseudomonas sp. TE3786]
MLKANTSLVEPIIDVLRFEKQIIGGDAVLLKKALKAIGQLGNQGHIPSLEAGFDFNQEQRADVQEAYAATLARLKKKRPETMKTTQPRPCNGSIAL